MLLPGDPGRALLLAETIIDSPRMFNHHRGLWGYTGASTVDGEPLSIQSTGVGGPSAAIVLEELIALGAEVAIRVGTCRALHPSLQLGDLVVATEAIAADGVGIALGGGGRLRGDESLTGKLVQAGKPALAGPIVTTDLFFEPRAPHRKADWAAEGAIALEMEAAALFAVAKRRQVSVACMLTVSDVVSEDGIHTRIDDETLLARSKQMGAATAAALQSASLARR